MTDRDFWQGLEFWVSALHTWAITERMPVTDVTVQYRRGDALGPKEPVAWGTAWAVPDASEALLWAVVSVPDGSSRLVVKVDGEALLRVNDVPAWGVNPHHLEADLSREAGQTVQICVAVVPRGAFGRPILHPRFESMTLHHIDPDIEATAWDLAVLVELGRREATGAAVRNWLAPRLLEAVAPLRAMAPDEAVWRERMVHRSDSSVDAGLYQRLITEGGQVLGLTAADPAVLCRAVMETRRRLATLHRELSDTWPAGVGRLVAIGHAHIDLAWLWPIGETRRKILRTVATQDRLLDQFPAWTYLMSSPEMWQGVAETEPALFRRMEAQVAAGRLVPAGATWVECDAQLPSAAAVLRHLVYAGRYFVNTLGQRPRVAFLPDTFGFAGGWPTLLALAGIDMMVTTKLLWNDTTKFPYSDFRWVGPDGSAVAVSLYGGAAAGYNGSATLADLDRAWAEYEQRGGADRVLYTFGFGDGGGGPTREMLERLSRYRELPMIPRIEWGTLEDLIPDAAAASRWPQHRGDLYLEYHRGVFTTQTVVKRTNRRLETWLNALQAWSTALDLPTASFADAWRRVLRNQFHDILPGSSIAEVYRDWREDLDQVETLAAAAGQAVAKALGGAGDAGPALAVSNLAGVNSAPRLVTFPTDAPVDVLVDGAWVPAHATYDGKAVVPIGAVPALAIERLPLRVSGSNTPAALSPTSSDGSVTVSVPFGTVTIGPSGLEQWTYRGRELLESPAGVVGFYDHPTQYDAWELSPQYRTAPVTFTHAPLSVVEDNPYRMAVRLGHRTGHTTVTETVVVDRVHGYVSTQVAADVQDRHLVLRWEAPTTLVTSAAEADGLWGMSRHPTVPEGSNDQAAFEWVAHRFVSLAEQQVGLVIANDGRYGHSVDGGRLGVTLSTAPLYPDPDADQRPSPANLLLMPHDGRWATPRIVGEAYAWSWGMMAERVDAAPSGAFAPIGAIPDQVVVLGWWPAADGSRDVVVTLGETYGTGADFWLTAPWAARGAAAVDPVTEAACPDDPRVKWAPDRQAARVVLKAHGMVALRFQRA